MEIDTARSPEPHRLSPTTDPGSIPTLDGWIESLMNCKQLAESDVQRLCDRVSVGVSLCDYVNKYSVLTVPNRPEKYYKKNLMYNRLYVLFFT